MRESILQRCKGVEQTAIEQATDNAILEQLSKVCDIFLAAANWFEFSKQIKKTEDKALSFFFSADFLLM